MQIPVQIKWPQDANSQTGCECGIGGCGGPVNQRSGVLSTEHSQSSYGIPVLVMDGQQFGAADMPLDSKIFLRWGKPRIGPVWAVIQSAIDAGFPIRIDPMY